MTPEERHTYRLKNRSHILEAFSAWLQDQRSKELPKSPFGMAVTHCLNQSERLRGFMKDGRLEIDNNRSERSIKPFVFGRKNWIFSNTPRGALPVRSSIV
jgi:transposase